MKARKLLANDLLAHLWLRYSVGVPIRKLHRDAKLNISIPVFTLLIKYYEESNDITQPVSITNTIYNSLFPEWLHGELKHVQSQPPDWKYIGQFPLGKWLKINEDN